jgi:E3 ubiquitin-protein ligase NRDP1
MMSGVHYWEIHADPRTENELKIGVCNNDKINFNTAFCDTPYGWAYYGLAQLRHNSNASGAAFGKRFKKEGILGVCLDMNKGIYLYIFQ